MRTISQQISPEDQARPPPDYKGQEKRKLIPQDKGETPSKKEMKRTREDEMEDAGLPYVSGRNTVPLRMIRGEHREIEEEIANRILSDISEEGSISGSLASIDDLEGAFVPKREEVGLDYYQFI
ncbi:unnamed protein product [Strongylus vulgaris]|uniref:Uncharacterized protein n=1 Tax=Strongylus vulgaris TaxID=40348 RepID=A0A3P7LJP9_STRVU|nr:unnamed protein product [Strongylus vulgaris]